MPVEEISQQLAPYEEAFERVPHNEAQRAAFDQFLTQGFPSSRDENWKFTNLAPLTKMAFEPAQGRHLADAAKFLERFPVESYS